MDIFCLSAPKSQGQQRSDNSVLRGGCTREWRRISSVCPDLSWGWCPPRLHKPHLLRGRPAHVDHESVITPAGSFQFLSKLHGPPECSSSALGTQFTPSCHPRQMTQGEGWCVTGPVNKHTYACLNNFLTEVIIYTGANSHFSLPATQLVTVSCVLQRD